MTAKKTTKPAKKAGAKVSPKKTIKVKSAPKAKKPLPKKVVKPEKRANLSASKKLTPKK